MNAQEHSEAPGAPAPGGVGPASPSRRHWMLLGVGLAAAATGAGLAWWRFSPRSEDEQALAQFWASRFESPDGTLLEMAAFRGRPLLLNFWATWCPPCVQELPRLNAFHAAHQAQGWQVLGLAIDQLDSVRGFLQRTPLGFPQALPGAAGLALVRGLGNPGGGLPFSVLFAPNGRIAERKIGELSDDDLQQWRTAL
ncbi:TlpA disulfide reductase family protein [Comamonas sp. NLF-1-9]|uniref:TlpA family protein disulfide reductase n=1 Tax=Comamonas sp. NLF-1-9 TaxID=2853163 RepID=UPI001C45CD4B|nr:TlpA disulfide reductase family protein [Comamonas sp. NLF-1-9]QXL83378.1 TlpA family protein disulfide reductase [Comamonas sp. NLF-1-9]